MAEVDLLDIVRGTSEGNKAVYRALINAERDQADVRIKAMDSFQTLLAFKNFLDANNESISRFRSGKQRSQFIEAVLKRSLEDRKFREAVLVYKDISGWYYRIDDASFKAEL